MGGWKRVGVVLSVLWFLGGGFWENHREMEVYGNFFGYVYGICQNTNDMFADAKDKKDCFAFAHSSANVFEREWGSVLFVALVPIPFAWLFVYIIMCVVRWVRKGFKPA